MLDLSADSGSRWRFGGAQVPFVVEDDGVGYPAVRKVVQAVFAAFMAGGTDEMGIAHFWSGMKTARIDSAQVNRFPAQRIARLSAGCPTIVAIKVDNRLADAAIAVETDRVIRPFLAGSPR